MSPAEGGTSPRRRGGWSRNLNEDWRSDDLLRARGRAGVSAAPADASAAPAPRPAVEMTVASSAVRAHGGSPFESWGDARDARSADAGRRRPPVRSRSPPERSERRRRSPPAATRVTRRGDAPLPRRAYGCLMRNLREARGWVARHYNELLVALLLGSTLAEGAASGAGHPAPSRSRASSSCRCSHAVARRWLVLLAVLAAGVGRVRRGRRPGGRAPGVDRHQRRALQRRRAPRRPPASRPPRSSRRFAVAVEVDRLGATKAEDLAGEFLFLAGVWALGRWVRQRRRRTERLEERTAPLEADRDERARAAVAEERARIAREMHDSVAHTVSVMVLQAGAAEQTLAVAPERARESLVTIQDAGREAIVELHRMLGRPREPVGELALDPHPGVARLDALVDQVRRAGLPVELSVRGRAAPPAGRRGPLRVPDRAGRAHQHAQARRRRARERPPQL